MPTGIQRVDAASTIILQQYIVLESVDADIAIIDSGIDLDHPDLNVYRNTTAIIPQGTSQYDQELCDKDIDIQEIGLNTYENN